MSRHPSNILRPGASRRGSVIILVVSILSVLGLMALTFSYSTRMELKSSRNWADKVQANMAAITGLETEDPVEPPEPPVKAAAMGQQAELAPVSLRIKPSLAIDGQFTRTTSQEKAYLKSGRLAARQSAITGLNPGNPEALADFLVEDTSAKININAVLAVRDSQTPGGDAAPSALTEETLARLIEDVLAAAGINTIDPSTLAHNIVMYRYGPDGRPGIAGVDDNGDARMTALSDNTYDPERDGLRDADGSLLTHLNRDRLDNNRDGVIDEAGESVESDGLDNDFDGQIDEAGEGVDDPFDALIDIRKKPRGDDRPYVSISQLMNVEGMTPEACLALEPYLTVFSASHAAYALSSAESVIDQDTGTKGRVEGLPKVDPNTAAPEVLYETLKRRLPSTDSRAIGQFVANMIDRRDQDDIPTRLTLDGREYYGIEMTPCINEVCPDTSSLDEEGDDGQFIELFNPYSKAMSIEGWRLEGAGTPIRLTGSLPSGGYLVLTDDFNNENDPTPEWDTGQGSFFNIFNVMPTGGKKRLEEVPTLDLPNETGQVKLLDNTGKLVDSFSWTKGAWTGAPLSFQRINPRLRFSQHVMATPLAANDGFDDSELVRNSLEIQEKWQNKPFRSALDVMLVSSAYAEASAEDDQSRRRNDSQFWALPGLRAGDQTSMDLRLTDCFRIGTVLPELTNTSTVASASDGLSGLASSDALSRRSTPTQVPCDTQFGLLNLNTAPPAVLAALPGMTPSLVNALYAARMTWLHPQQDASVFLSQALDRQNPQWWMSVHPNAEPCWNNLSDFLLDDTIWQDRPLYDRLDAAYPFYRLLTTHSQALRVISANRQPQAPDGEPERAEANRPTYTRAERIITSDRGSVETVTFRFLDRHSILDGDPDQRYAVEDPNAEKSYVDELKKFDPYLSGRALDQYPGSRVSRK